MVPHESARRRGTASGLRHRSLHTVEHESAWCHMSQRGVINSLARCIDVLVATMSQRWLWPLLKRE